MEGNTVIDADHGIIIKGKNHVISNNTLFKLRASAYKTTHRNNKIHDYNQSLPENNSITNDIAFLNDEDENILSIGSERGLDITPRPNTITFKTIIILSLITMSINIWFTNILNLQTTMEM